MKNTILLVGVLSLAACSPTHDDLNMWIKQTQDKAKTKVTPFQAPTITPPVAYTPPAYNGLNAFDYRRLENAPKGNNAPNLNRQKETLEAFSLENMRYVGILRGNNKTSGFIDVNGHVYTVMPGNYIGQNYGKIQTITEDKITFTELIEDSSGNWIYRKAELPLSTQSDEGSSGASTAEARSESAAIPN